MHPCRVPRRLPIAPCSLHFVLAGLLFLLLLACGKPALAEGNDRVNFAQRIVIAQDDTAGNVVCFLCSVEVHGNVDGDIVTFLGGVKSDGQMHGDLVSFLGDVNLAGNATLDGQIVLLGGNLRKGEAARLGENQVVLPAGIFLLPFILIGAIIWGISRIFRRRPMYYRRLR